MKEQVSSKDWRWTDQIWKYLISECVERHHRVTEHVKCILRITHWETLPYRIY